MQPAMGREEHEGTDVNIDIHQPGKKQSKSTV